MTRRQRIIELVARIVTVRLEDALDRPDQPTTMLMIVRTIRAMSMTM